MRTTHTGVGEERRTLADVFADALTLLRQDVAEYGFAALIGAILAAFASLVLWSFGFAVARALIAPAVFVVAVFTFANTCAAVRRVFDNLQPDAVSAFVAVLGRSESILAPMLLPLALSWASVLACIMLAGPLGSGLATTLGMAMLAVIALRPFNHSLYITGLFARQATPESAAARSAQAMKAAGSAYGLLVAVSLTPAALVGLIMLADGLGVLSTAIAAFVFVLSMPIPAAVASYVYEGAVIAPASGSRRDARGPAIDDDPGYRDPAIEDRLRRIR